MNRKYGIGFLLGIVILIIMFVFIFQFSYSRAIDRNEEKNQKEEQAVTDGYIIKEEDGYVIVYRGDTDHVYEYTSLWVDDLPSEVGQSVRDGIYMENLSEVYGFLENYSS